MCVKPDRQEELQESLDFLRGRFEELNRDIKLPHSLDAEVLRARLEEACRERGLSLYMPPLSLCGDNAAMIGAQGYYEFLAGKTAGLDLNAWATLPVEA